MGLYDDTGFPRRYLKYIGLLVLLLLDVYLLLPSPYLFLVSSDKDLVHPGEDVLVWVEVINNSGAPLSGVYLRVDSRSSQLEVTEDEVNVPDVPPGGKTTLKTKVMVSPDATFGDHLLRVFLSYPGKTEVLYYRVRVG